MGRTPNRLPNYFKMQDITDLSLPAEHIIDTDGTTIWAYDCDTGECISYGTDAATVIQAAIDARTVAQGNSIFIKPGTYVITKTIVLHGNMKIRGAGIDVTILTADGQSQNWDILEFTPAVAEYFIAISDMTIKGDGADGTSGHNIHTDNDDGGSPCDLQIDQVFIKDAVDNGLDLLDTWGFRITNCLVERSGDYGIYLFGGTQNYLSNCYIALNKGAAGVYIGSGSSIVSNCNISSNEHIGLTIANSASFCGISNCVVYSNGTAAAANGIHILVNSNCCTLTGNIITSNTDYGLHIDGDNCQAAGNFVLLNTNGQYKYDGYSSTVNDYSFESSNAETPTMAFHPGIIVEFVDTGDGTGTGFYIRDIAGNWHKLA